MSRVSDHELLASRGVIPVAAGDGLEDRIRDVADGAVNALIDTVGHDYVRLGVNLGIVPGRITNMDFATAQEVGAKTAGNMDAASAKALPEIARMIADGRLTIPIARTYPLDRVREAYSEMETKHPRGKIVVIP